MKKLCILILALTLCTSLIACSQSAPQDHEQLESTTLPPTTPETTAPTTTEPPKEIHWTEEFYVDEFGDPTSESYIRGIFEGTFSNSATAGSHLTVCFFMNKDLAHASYDMFEIRLLEYGDHRVSFIGCGERDVTIKVKIDGVISEDYADYLLSDSGEIVLQRGNKIFKAVIDALEADKKISFIITISGYGTDTYRFDIDANGLADIPHEWRSTI